MLQMQWSHIRIPEGQYHDTIFFARNTSYFRSVVGVPVDESPGVDISAVHVLQRDNEAVFLDNLYRGQTKHIYCTVVRFSQRRRITTEENAKIVAAVWGIERIQFLAARAILHHDDLKKGMNSSYSATRPWCKMGMHGKELNKFCPPSSSDDYCLLFCIHPSYMATVNRHRVM